MRDIGNAMALDEAARLVHILTEDPSSATAAALAGWSHPMSREALILADLFDLEHFSKAKKQPQSYPRPWPTAARTVARMGNTGGRSREEVIEILRTRFGNAG